ncbi:hypothetical protein DPMN_112840 [Dreissena polymorpha]|uniref:Uncharacterized protein n=1 Tax=Dreissena polymorpha TaxID=45954 RepID=A0A9D4KH21_DREPO|nr:hypothetical protein DPMN_112840 [Dreissena polymorpha]
MVDWIMLRLTEMSAVPFDETSIVGNNGYSPMMRFVNLCVNNHLKKSIISLGDLDLEPSDLKPHQKVEVHARYLHAKYERDR